ncbi:MAG TPA: hypothetical protein VF593_08795 [Chthoniobacteraceae bacterium]
MNTTHFRCAARMLLLLGFSACAASSLKAEETPALPELRDVATGEVVPPAETTRTKEVVRETL